ncbi:MAG: InlB B-repeat-containing protein [Clostridia bacterium]|nr:InlB B-repeat-containing protein [Clostridia bacterium]
MTHLKKSLALLLAIVMIFSSMSVAASAAAVGEPDAGDESVTFTVKFFRNENRGKTDEEGNPLPEKWVETTKAAPGEYVKARVYLSTNFATHTITSALLFDTDYFEAIKAPASADATTFQPHQQNVTVTTASNPNYAATATGGVQNQGALTSKKMYRSEVTGFAQIKYLLSEGYLEEADFEGRELIHNIVSLDPTAFPKTVLLTDANDNWYDEFNFAIRSNGTTMTVDEKGKAEIPASLRGSIELYNKGVKVMLVNIQKGKYGADQNLTITLGEGWEISDNNFISNEGWITTTSSILLDANDGQFSDNAEIAEVRGIIEESIESGVSEKEKEVSRAGYTLLGWSNIETSKGALVTDEILKEIGFSEMSNADIAALGWKVNSNNIGFLKDAFPKAKAGDFLSEEMVAVLDLKNKDLTTLQGYGLNVTTEILNALKVDEPNTDFTHDGYTLYALWDNSGLAEYKVETYLMDTNGAYPSVPTQVDSFYAEAGTTVPLQAVAREGFVLDKNQVSDEADYPEKFTRTPEKSSESVVVEADSENPSVLKAYYTRNQYKLTYKYEDITGEHAEEELVYFGDVIDEFDSLPTDKYTLTVTDGEGNPLTAMPEKMPAHDIIATADIQIVYLFDAGEGATFPNGERTMRYVYKFGATPEIPAAPSMSGYTFVDWDVDIPEKATGDMSFNAMYNPLGGTEESYTVTFYDSKGEIIATEDGIWYGYEYEAVDIPEGYLDTVWKIKGDESNEPVSFPYVITGNTEFEPVKENANVYNAYFYADETDAEPFATSATKYGEAVVAPGKEPEKYGHGFKGWSTNPDATEPDADLGVMDSTEGKNFYAVFAPNEVTLTFNTGEGATTVEPVNGKFDEEYTKPADPVKPGYKFDGWLDEDGKLTSLSDTLPAESEEYTAKWTALIYNVIYKNGDQLVGDIEKHATDSAVTVNDVYGPALQKEGHTFAGWESSADGKIYNPADSEAPSAFVMPAGDVTLTAKWTVNNYVINLNADGGSFADGEETFAKDEIAFGSDLSAIVPADPEWSTDEKTFAGWADAEDATDKVIYAPGELQNMTMPADSLNLKAVWADVVVPTYTATFYANGGYFVVDGENKTETTVTYEAGETITPPIPVRDDGEYNYTWLPTVPDVMPAKDMEFHADWEAVLPGSIAYTITPMIEVLKADGSTEVITGAVINKTGEEGAVVEITDDTTSTATIRHPYTNLINNNSVVPDTENENNALKVILTEGGENNLVAYFKLATRTAEFDGMGGTFADANDAAVSAYHGTKITLPTEKEITKDGFKLLGWKDSDDNEFDPGEELSLIADETYEAIWEEIKYNLTFDEGDGVPEAIDQLLAEGKSYNVPILSKDGYRFNGWYDAKNDKLYKPGETFTMPAEDVELKADFTKLYKVTYLDAQGNEYDSGVAAEGEAIPALTKPNPEKHGYRFGGWKNIPADGKVPASDLALEPIFNELFTLSYVYEYEEEGFPALHGSVELIAGEEITVKALPSLDGYRFSGWTYGESTYAPGDTFTMPAEDADLVATPNQIFNLTFNEGEGTKVSDAQLIAGEEYELPESYRDGFTFRGWSDGFDEYPAGTMYVMPGEDIELEAKWDRIVPSTTERPEYTITFEIENGAPEGLIVPQPEKVDAGDYCKLPGLVLEGYVFDYWYDGDARYPANYEYVPKGNVTLIARYTKVEEPTTSEPTTLATYTVSFAIDGESIDGITLPEPIDAKDGERIKLPELPAKDGIKFSGWFDEGNGTFPAGYMYRVDGNVTLVARWEEIPTEPTTTEPTTIAKYALIFDEDGGSEVADMNLAEGESIYLPKTSKDGKVFAGWTDGANTYDVGEKFTMPANPVELKAVWEEATTVPAPTEPTTVVKYALTFDEDDGSEVDDVELAEGDSINLPKTSKDGKVFAGWTDGTKTYESGDKFTMPANPVELKAVWNDIPTEPTKYTLSFNTNGGSAVADKTLLPGAVINLPKTELKDHEFVAWEDKDGNRYDAGDEFKMPEGNAELTAIWKKILPVDYDLGYAYIGEVIPENAPEVPETKKVTEGTLVTVADVPMVDGYKFSGWYYNGSIVTSFTMPKADVTLEGVWTVDLSDEKIYTVTYTFDGNAPADATVPVPVNVKEGETVTLAEVPTAEGYTFDGWYYGTEIVTSFTMPGNDVTITGKWTVNKYDITLDANGGEFEDGSAQFTDTVEYGKDLDDVLPDVPQKEGYTFVGWVDEDGNPIPETMPDGPIDATAEWKINEYTITFDSNGGSEVPAATYEYGATVAEPVAPTRAGFIFKGWEPALPATMPANDLKVKAVWEAEPGVETFEFTADANGGAFADGSTSIEKELAEGEAIGELPTPTRDGYEFTGWEGIPEDGKMPASDLKITATWKEIVPEPETHKVTYYLVKGEDGVAEAYTSKTFKEGEALTHPDVEIEGFTFKGWTDKDGNPLPETMGTEDIEAYANLEINSYKVTYYLAAGEVYEEYADVKFASEVPVPADPTKEGYIFAGWEPAVASTMPAHDLTYTAKWVTIPVGGEEYTARYVVDGKTYALYVLEEGDSIPVPAAPTKFGFVFVGWEPEVPATMPGENVEFEAQWEVDKTFLGIVIGGTVVSGVVIGSVIGANAAWITGISIVGGIIVIVGAAALIKHTHTVTFMVDGEVYKVYKVVEGTKIPVPADPAKDGAEFAGWNPEVPEKMGNTDLVFEATWEDVGADVDVVIPDTGSFAGVAAFAVISGAAAAAYVIARKKKED